MDTMGGDYAPAATVAGAVMARAELPASAELVLIGNKDQILKELEGHNADPDAFSFVHTTEVLDMGDHPVKSFSLKKDSSLVKGFELLSRGELDAFCSAGNTGAMMVGAMIPVACSGRAVLRTRTGMRRSTAGSIVAGWITRAP